MNDTLNTVAVVLGYIAATAVIVAFWGFALFGWARLLGRYLRSGGRSLELKLTRPRLPKASTVADLPELNAELGRAPVLMVLPLHDPSAGELAPVGLALSRLMIRRLMRRPQLSVRGPEDTPAAGVAAIEQLPAELRAAQHVLGGTLERDGQRYVARAWLSAPQGEPRVAELAASTLPELLGQLAAAATQWLAPSASASAEEHLSALELVTPVSEADFRALGDALLQAERAPDELEADEALLSALDRGPQLSIVASALSSYQLHTKLRVLDAAPCDAQLAYSIALDVWNGSVETAQTRAFLLRALELAPAHARANAIAFRMAKTPSEHVRRTKLGYALAPGCAFAAHQYVLCLVRHSDAGQPLCDVASALVALEPSDPIGLWGLMNAYNRLGDRERAIEAAQRLLRWVDPLDARAEQQLRADKGLRYSMDIGWSPAEEAKELIEGLKRGAAA